MCASQMEEFLRHERPSETPPGQMCMDLMHYAARTRPAIRMGDSGEKPQSMVACSLDGCRSQVLRTPGLTVQHSLRSDCLNAWLLSPFETPWSDVVGADAHSLDGALGPFVSCHGIGPCIGLFDSLKPVRSGGKRFRGVQVLYIAGSYSFLPQNGQDISLH